MLKDIIEHYNRLAPERDLFRQKNAYYYTHLTQQYRYLVPEGKRVLEVGCSTGELLNSLKPAVGVGMDVSSEMITLAKKKFSQYEFFCGTIDDYAKSETFDYIILSGLLGELEDIQKFFDQLQRFCHPHTRIIIEYYSYFWQYVLKIAEQSGSKIPQKIQNWVTHHDVCNFLALTGYEPIKTERVMLCPLDIPILSPLINRFIAPLPVINALTLNHFIIARPLRTFDREFDVTVLVPCRNEKGNLEAAVTRTPRFGRTQEILFVEGGSSDGTYEEALRLMQVYPERNIRVFKQTGKGKGDAVRVGYAQAKGEVLIILDADLTVPPEDLPKFYDAIRHNRGEFINGCRLVYPMEKQAMRFLNLLANKFFGVFFSWLLGQRFKDTLCGTKVLFKHHWEEIVKNRTYFGDFDPFGDFDMIFGAIKLNLKVIELPIRYKERTYGTTNIQRFRQGLILLNMCFFAMKKIKFR